jgi:hypothetical protein
MAGLPISPPFANVHANADAEMNTAAVAAGAVNAAAVGLEALRKRKALDMSSVSCQSMVTAAEAGDAVLREASAIAQAAPGAGAPPWFAAAMALAIGPLEATVNNLRVFQSNLRAYGAQSLVPSPFIPPNKEIQGFGPAGGGAPPPNIAAVFAAPPPNPGLGVVPPAALPFLLDCTTSLTIAEIGYLCRWYNDNMRILPGDLQPAQLQKLKMFLCGT